ncbi:hypothetical protein [Dysgonomonas sp. 520]|uniref:hypothetical protein n=1 Tax=Dysgonomonas sp. 520 TaxID=2302931 RepID=UPI0013CFC387|nr:hypothetical protein [Dysgonomonas sp. 520]NDW10383.1 hypothetical protein [Dysgonomonas sp. 520]
MKKSSLILLIFLAVTALKAQVGVNTENPQGIFHIDGKRDTNGSTNIADDVMVDTQGRIGIGTNAPQTKIDIRTTTKGGGFRLQDGSQQTGKVLTSSANGEATWEMPGFSKFEKIPTATCPISTSYKVSNVFRTIIKLPGGNPYIIPLPETGTYALTMGLQLNLSNVPSDGTVSRAILQLLPDNDIELWNNNTIPKFEGAYEIYGTVITESDIRFYLSENITTTISTGNDVYIALAVVITGTNIPTTLTGTMNIGQGASVCKHCSGGSFVKIN